MKHLGPRDTGSMGGLQSSTLISQCTPTRGAGVRDPHGTRYPLPPWTSSEARTGTHRCPGCDRGWHSGLPGAGGLAWLPVGPAPAAFCPHEALARSGMPLAGHRGPDGPLPLDLSPDVATLTLSAAGTGALVGVGEVDAGAAVLARVGQALIDLLGAVHPVVAGHTLSGGRQGLGLWLCG